MYLFFIEPKFETPAKIFGGSQFMAKYKTLALGYKVLLFNLVWMVTYLLDFFTKSLDFLVIAW